MSTTSDLTQWVDTITGDQLDRGTLAELQAKAHRTYEANAHIFEDEAEALTALGVLPIRLLDTAAA